MITNLQSIIVDQPIPGLTGVSFTKCTTLADVLAALAAGSGSDVYAVSGAYDPATETLVMTLSNGSAFSIPATDLLPVLTDGVTIRGSGVNGSPLVGYQVNYTAATGALTILAADGTVTTAPAQTAQSEAATDTMGLLGTAGATVTTQQLLDYVGAHLSDCYPGDTLEIPASAFADPVNPTQVEAQAWIDAQGPLAPGTQIIYNRFADGDGEDPEYVWLVNEIGDATNIERPALAALTTNAGSRATVTAPGGATLNVPDPLPVASFVRTSKLGLTAAYSAASSSGTQEGNPLTYAWSAAPRASTVGTATLATPADVSSTVAFSAPGHYDVTLTVTDANGNSSSQTQPIKVSRTLEVGGANSEISDYVATVGDAINWINANDPPSATAPWTILVADDTQETQSMVTIPTHTTLQGIGHPTITIAERVEVSGAATDARLIDLQITSTVSTGAALIVAGPALNTQLRNVTVDGALHGTTLSGINMTVDGLLSIARNGVGIVVGSATAPTSTGVMTNSRGYGGGTGAVPYGLNLASRSQWRLKQCQFFGAAYDQPTGPSTGYGITFSGIGGEHNILDHVDAYANPQAFALYHKTTNTGVLWELYHGKIERRTGAFPAIRADIPLSNRLIVNTIIIGGIDSTITPIAGADNVIL